MEYKGVIQQDIIVSLNVSKEELKLIFQSLCNNFDENPLKVNLRRDIADILNKVGTTVRWG